MKYWQVAAGQGARDYSDIFLKYGVMFIGGGNPGSYSDHPESYEGRKDWRTKIVRFARRASVGDAVILKKPRRGREKSSGRWQMQSVGHIVGEYDYLDQFDDVEGWDLQHTRRVEWFQSEEKVFTDGLSMGTFKRVHNPEPIEKAKQVLSEGIECEVNAIPEAANELSDEDLVERLIDNGLRPADSERVIQSIRHVRRLAGWYERHGRDLGEHEIRTFLIVPILLALGWSEQRIKIEWKHTDISFFLDVFKRGQQPIMILESKRMREGLHYAERQVRRYAIEFPECSKLIVSDGIRYQLYIREGQEWSRNPQDDFKAYMNLTNLKDRHPYLELVRGASDLFISLMPR